MKTTKISLLMLVIILFSSSIINSQTKNVLVDQKNSYNLSIDSIGHWNDGQNRKNFEWRFIEIIKLLQ
jgi:hypothetical protein